MSRRSTILGMILLAVFIVVVQQFATRAGKEYYLTQATMASYYTTVVLGLCLVMGYAGQISLGHGAFFALGGYTSAILTTADMGRLADTGLGGLLSRAGVLIVRQDLYGSQFSAFSAWPAFLVAVLLAGTVAALVGFPALRLKGHYLAMGTLGFGLIVYRILLGGEFTGGADGISSVPPWHLLPGVQICGSRAHRVVNFYVAAALTGLALLFIVNVVDSRTGRALRSIHGGERAANAMGINTAGYKLLTFVISAVLAAVAGCFFAHYNGAIAPAEAGAMRSVRYVALVAAGGMANVWGALIVGSVLTFLSLRGFFGTMDHAVFGLILILIMTLAPHGPLGPLGRSLTRLFGVVKRRFSGPAQEHTPGLAAGEQ